MGALKLIHWKYPSNMYEAEEIFVILCATLASLYNRY